MKELDNFYQKSFIEPKTVQQEAKKFAKKYSLNFNKVNELFNKFVEIDWLIPESPFDKPFKSPFTTPLHDAIKYISPNFILDIFNINNHCCPR